jgi:ABC-2 type transport system ATP-binding protein
VPEFARGQAFLEVEHLTKAYRGGWGLHDVSFSLPAGAIVALGGPNGSGKSTLLKCLAGLSRFDGTARLDGEVLDARPGSRRNIGFLPQRVSMPEASTIGEVLDFFAALRRADRDDVPLPEGFVRPDEDLIGELSGGQRHRVSLAVALLGRPRLLLLDEPVASLDEGGRAEFWTMLQTLRDREGVTSIVSSPSPSELRRVADRALHVDDGRLVLEEDLTVQRLVEAATPGADGSLEACS